MTTDRPTAAIVLSGDELLDGRTRDSNGRLLASVLSGRGVRVVSLTLVGDDRERLVETLRCALSGGPDLLLVGGGLGTTHDDLTAECLADALDVPLREHADALAMVAERARDVAERRGLDPDEVLAAARRQACLPVGARPLPPVGVAPGIAAVAGGTRVFAFPGVPWELRRMWAEVEAALDREGFFPPVVTRLVRIYGAGEQQVTPVLERCEHERLWVGINIEGAEVTVILRHAAGEAAQRQSSALTAALESELPVFSTDGRTVDDLVAEALCSSGATIAVAESCTGGLLGARLTARPGSSDYMRGGIVAYADEVKTALLDVPADLLARYGAVSEEVAAAMAAGARRATGATWGLGVTGVAGPTGGSADKPVGLVFVACAGPRGTRTVGGRFPGDRDSVRAWSVARALHMLREELEA